MTRVHVIYGEGGVGKTSTAAAVAVALARAGARTLVVTTDPARRLADALDVPAATAVTPVPWCPGLACWMPEARATLRVVVDDLLAGEPALAASLARNQVFALLCSGLAGMHELATLAGLDAAAQGFDEVVIDTAPGRHGLELIALPARLVALVESPALVWLGRLADTGAPGPRGVGRRLLDWGQQRLVAQFERAVGGATVGDTLEVLRAVMIVRPRLAAVARAAGTLLVGPSTRHVIVVAPGPGAEAQADATTRALASAGCAPSLYVVNRAVAAPPAWLVELEAHDPADGGVRAAIGLARREAAAAQAATAAAGVALGRLAPTAYVASVPAVAATRAVDVVEALAVALGPTVCGPARAALGPPRAVRAAGVAVVP